MNKILKNLLIASVFTVSGVANAALITGAVQVDGSGTLNVAPSNASPGATQLTMFSVGNINGNQALLTGDFDTYLNPGNAVAINTTTVTFEPTFSGSIANFWSAGGFSFELTSLTQVTEIKGFINLTGSGWLTGNGFDQTIGNITITGTGQNALVGISSTTVPEPAILAMLGLGLVGVGVARKSRKA